MVPNERSFTRDGSGAWAGSRRSQRTGARTPGPKEGTLRCTLSKESVRCASFLPTTGSDASFPQSCNQTLASCASRRSGRRRRRHSLGIADPSIARSKRSAATLELHSALTSARRFALGRVSHRRSRFQAPADPAPPHFFPRAACQRRARLDIRRRNGPGPSQQCSRHADHRALHGDRGAGKLVAGLRRLVRGGLTVTCTRASGTVPSHTISLRLARQACHYADTTGMFTPSL